MEKQEGQISSNSLKDSQQTPLTLEHALSLLNLTELPGGNYLEAFFLKSTARLIAQNGEDWVRGNRVRLVEELEILANF